jgi:hypothetical protein
LIFLYSFVPFWFPDWYLLCFCFLFFVLFFSFAPHAADFYIVIFSHFQNISPLYKTAWNDINIMADPNLHECTLYIIRDKSLLHVMENAPNERGGEIITFHWSLEAILFLKTPKRLRSRD